MSAEKLPIRFAQPGDFILCHRKGLVSSIIRWGERLRFKSGSRWSHCVFIMRGLRGELVLVEALTRGVVVTPLSAYEGTDYELVKTGLYHYDSCDYRQAEKFAESCIGQKYGWLTIAGIALRFLTPGRGLWFGMDGTEICSGLVAQTQVRGWKIFDVNPTSITPAELAEAYEVRTEGKR